MVAADDPEALAEDGEPLFAECPDGLPGQPWILEECGVDIGD